LDKKRIVFLTGTRADFGKIKPLINSIKKSNEFEYFIFVTGMHTLAKYGNTFHEVQKNDFENVFVFMNQTHTTDSDLILANTIIGFGNFVKEISPDMIIIHGDRIEALAGGIVGSLNKIIVAHIEGGEISGTIDESIRHAVTKLSHLHFASNENAKKVLIQLGENEKNIFVIGSPDIDIMNSGNLPTLKESRKKYQIPFTDYGILLFHPVSSEIEKIKKQIEGIISAVIDSKENFIVVYPNNEEGADVILKEYKKLEKNSKFKIFPSIRFEYFLTFLKNSKFILGNSSVGIRESIVFGIPSINLGTRQNNRSKNKNILNIKIEKNKILKSIKEPKVKFTPNFDFGNGKSTEKFMKIINDKKIWKTDIQKQFLNLKD
jgi:UDP-N-acetylglucosamine 2-epimerase (hydrolysing)